jgi:hypothetical protein
MITRRRTTHPGRAAAARRPRRLHQPQRIVTIPEWRAGRSAADAALLPLDVCQHVDAGPFESRPLRAFYYITDVEPSWPAERKNEHLRDFNYGALWSISMHEVFPGHFLHYQHLRQVDSKLRKSILFSSTALRRRVGALLRADDDRGGLPKNDHAVRLGQLAEALIRSAASSSASGFTARTCRSSRASVSSATRRSSRKPSARREAERGTFDPSYILYSAGKLMLLKLREDYKAQCGRKYSLRGFHDTLLGQWHGPGVVASRLDARRAQWRHADASSSRAGDRSVIRIELHAVVRIRVRGLSQPFERIQKFSIRRLTRARLRQGPGRESFSRRRRFSSRDRVGTSPTTRRSRRVSRLEGIDGHNGRQEVGRQERIEYEIRHPFVVNTVLPGTTKSDT